MSPARLLALALGLLPTLPAAAATYYADVNRMVVEQVALPAHRTLAEAAAGLRDRVAASCAAPADPALAEQARQVFRATVEAWQTAQVLRTGPAFEQARDSAIELWPDRHGTGARQLARVLATHDPSVLDPSSLAGKSKALQGLPVLERLLFEPADDAAFACAYAGSAAALLATLTGGIALDWAALAPRILAAGSAESGIRSPFEPARDFLAGAIDTLQIIVAQKIEGPLAPATGRPQPRMAELWRSDGSLMAIRANLATLERIVTGESGYLAMMADLGGDPRVIDRLRQSFEDALALIDGLGLPLQEAVQDAGARAEIERLLVLVKTIRQLTAAELAPVVGVGVGFNATDGD